MNSTIRTLFFILVIIQGILFAIFVPPNEVPDEGTHFARVYDIVQGNIIPSQPAVVSNDFLNLLTEYQIGFGKARAISINSYLKDFIIPHDKKETNTQAGTHIVAYYSPINYIPQIIGVLIGTALNLNVRWVFLLGRLFGLAFYILIVYTIIIKSRSFRHGLLVLFAMPMTVYLAASYSADGMLFSLSFLYIHSIITSSDSQTRLTKKEKILFSGLGILLALTKQTSLLLILLLVAIPTARFGSTKNKILFIGAQIFIALVFAMAWILITSSSFPSFIPDESVMPKSQLLYLLSNPLSTLKIVFSTLVALKNFYFKGFVGYFGWFTTPMPAFVYFLFIIGLLLAIIRDTQDAKKISNQQILIFTGVFCLYVAATILTLYILWTPFMSEITQGVQGRYFIPAFPLILYAFASFKFFHLPTIVKKILTGAALLIISTVLLLGFQTIYLKFFVLCGEFYYTPALADGCGLPQQLQIEIPDSTLGEIDSPVMQTFTPTCNNLHTVSFLLLPTSGEKTGYLNVQLIDDTNGAIIFDQRTFANKIEGNRWRTFYFSPIPDSMNRKFSINIQPEEHAITAATLGIMDDTDLYPDGELIGTDLSSDLIFSYRCPYGFRYDLKNLLGR
jgi:uncharacterized membrane protein